ncbi:hypothetical protein OTERR_20320 [Oryzomicrobium terrae]|uniref:Uncharacterized protein n=1 Tax=Oryzomicrobium terrae TaxID=1735038 RepID=A0A5C1EB93_9RHOO|nr:hypothetical protein OTERR_20320 [Oryzomicrobium terrae]
MLSSARFVAAELNETAFANQKRERVNYIRRPYTVQILEAWVSGLNQQS